MTRRRRAPRVHKHPIDRSHNGIRNATGVRRWAVRATYFILATPWMVSIGKGHAVDYYLDEVSVEDAIQYYLSLIHI